MNGWEVNEYNGVDGLTLNNDMALPVLKSPTEVLVEVYTTSVNPIDLLMTRGYGASIFKFLRWYDKVAEFPLVMGCEFCGVIKEKGSKVRDDLEIGAKVWGVVMPHKTGSQAEFVVVDQKNISLKPDSLTDIEAAGILYAGLTAWSSLFVSGGLSSNGRNSDKRICIMGASGGVGTLAVQMAKAENMEVTATCSTDSVQMVKDLGADHVFDYLKDNLKEKFSGQSYDIVLDAAGLGSSYATELPWKFGKYITLNSPLLINFDANGVFLGSMQNFFSFTGSNIRTIYHCRGVLKYGYFQVAPKGIEYFNKLIEDGKIKPVIESTFEFSEMKEAYQKVANGHLRGKVIVKVK